MGLTLQGSILIKLGGLYQKVDNPQLSEENRSSFTFDFDQQFSFYADYDPSTTSISAIEPALVEEIFEQLYVDIFNASVANW